MEVAQDICQQVFLKAMKNIGSYQHKGLPFSSWLYRIAFNECNNYFKQHKKERALNLSLKDFEIFEDDKEEKEILIRRMEQALSHLKASELQLIEMRFFEGRSVREISEILEISESNVKVKTHRAMEKLRTFANEG
jgi:RNA polymerase sigma-70 factor (ECF subfamily)